MTDHWRTPPEALERVFAVLGDVDLDPCAADDEDHHFADWNWRAAKYSVNFHNQGDVDEKIRESEGKLTYGNPPYSKLAVWVPFLASLRGPTIALIPPSIGTIYWHKHIFNHTGVTGLSGAQAVCFVNGRISFLDVDGRPARQNRYDSSFVLWRGTSEISARFFDVFSSIGKVIVP